jgi:hypothetical protein
MVALTNLQARAKSDPEDEDELSHDLADIKSKFGFKSVTHRIEGNRWAVEAEMNPRGKEWINADVGPFKEGSVAPHGRLDPIPTGMDRDHEPQSAVMQYVGQELKYKGQKLFAGTKMAGYTHGQGVCLLMKRERHKQTRTGGGHGEGTKAKALEKIQEALATKEVKDERTARKAVGKVVKHELEEDHKTVKSIYNASRLSQNTKDRIKSESLPKVWQLNRDEYFGAFDQ